MKKALSLLLVLSMVVSMMVLTVSAEDVALVPGEAQDITIAAGSSATVVVDATASEMILLVSGGRMYYDWNVEGRIYPNMLGNAEVNLPAGETYTLTINNTSAEDEDCVLSVVANPVLVGSANKPAVSERSPLNGMFLMNTDMEAFGEYHWTFTTDKAGIVCVETSGVEDYVVSTIIGDSYGSSFEGSSIVSGYVEADTEASVIITTGSSAGKVYVCANIYAGTIEDPVIVKKSEYYAIPVAAGASVTFVDGTSGNGIQAIEVSHFSADVMAATTVNVQGVDAAYTDVDGDGKIELNLSSGQGAHPYITITNGSEGPVTYTVASVASASEDVECTHKNVEHVEAQTPSCHFDGNIEYWFCADCLIFWQDAEQTQVTNSKNVVLPATGGEVEYVAESCYNVEHWICETCDCVWADEALTQVTNRKSVIKAEPTHNEVHVEATEVGCHTNGNIEYWYCDDCEGVWQDAELTQVTNIKNVVIPSAGTLEHTAESCYNVEYWYCAVCDCYFVQNTTREFVNVARLSLVKAEPTHNEVHVEATEVGCHTNGNIEYWYCDDCEGVWQDAELTQVTNIKNVVIPAQGELKHFARVEPTATEEGMMEHWYCAECDCYFVENTTRELVNVARLSLIIPKVSTPVTGDATNVIVLVALMAISAMGAAVIFTKKRRAA